MNLRPRGITGALVICTIGTVCTVVTLVRANQIVIRSPNIISAQSALVGELQRAEIRDGIRVGFTGGFLFPVHSGPFPPERCKYHRLEQNCTLVEARSAIRGSLRGGTKLDAEDPWKDLDAIVVRSDSGADNSFERFKEAKPNGVTAHMLMEGAHYFKDVARLEGVAEVSITVRRTTAEIPIVYFVPSVLNVSGGNPTDYLRDPVYVKPGLDYVYRGATFVARNCASKNHREKVVKFFKNQFKSRLNMTIADGIESSQNPLPKDRSSFVFDSISSCLKTAPWPDGLNNKFDALRQYMFTFAFENGAEVDYVTEKVYQAFIAGVVPVYMGAPNIDDFVPEGSIIKVSDFQDYQSLADYLVSLSNDPEEYKKFFRWRFDETLVAQLRKRFLPLFDPWECRLCRYTAGIKLNGKKRADWNKEAQDWY